MALVCLVYQFEHNKFGKIHNTLTYTLMFVISIYIVLGLINGSVTNLKPFISGTMGTWCSCRHSVAMLAYGSVMSVATSQVKFVMEERPKIIGTALTIVAAYALILLPS